MDQMISRTVKAVIYGRKPMVAIRGCALCRVQSAPGVLVRVSQDG